MVRRASTITNLLQVASKCLLKNRADVELQSERLNTDNYMITLLLKGFFLWGKKNT